MPESDGTPRTARLTGDLDDNFETYRDAKDMNNSEALRELVRVGLEEKRADPLDDRPDTLLAGLLWDARRDLHTFVLIALVATGLSFLTTGVVSTGFLIVAGLYALTVTVGAIDAAVLNSRLILAAMQLEDRVTVEVEA